MPQTAKYKTEKQNMKYIRRVSKTTTGEKKRGIRFITRPHLFTQGSSHSRHSSTARLYTQNKRYGDRERRRRRNIYIKTWPSLRKREKDSRGFSLSPHFLYPLRISFSAVCGAIQHGRSILFSFRGRWPSVRPQWIFSVFFFCRLCDFISHLSLLFLFYFFEKYNSTTHYLVGYIIITIMI